MIKSKKLVIIGVVLLVAGVFLVGGAVGQITLEEEHRPDYVDCHYNESLLEKHQPELDLRDVDNQPSSMYAQYCTSQESEYDIAMYWAYYSVQDGYSSEDSHRLDREPIYVFVNESGGVEKDSYSTYHYLKGVDDNPNLNGTHTKKYVVSPHHQYVSQNFTSGTFVDLRDFSTVQDDWYQNGWKANPEVTYNPYAIEYHSSWWNEDTSLLDYRATEWYWDLMLWIDSIIGEGSITDISF